MTGPSKDEGLRRILRLWMPMASTWLMMALEAPFLAAIIARLADPKFNLAAFGVAHAVAIVFESPVIMILSASTALVVGPISFARLRRFTHALNVVITVSLLTMLFTPGWVWFAEHAIGLPPRVVELSQGALMLLLPWPAAIGYRRFYQGLLIRHGKTRLIAYGTVIRLTTVTATSVVLFVFSDLPGTLVGAAALGLAVSLEAIASRFMAVGVVRSIRETAADLEGEPLTYGRITHFYTPLALTSIISLAVHPMVTFFMGQARFALESLAVLPVVNSLSFIFRAVGLSYQEVAIALLGEDRGDSKSVGRFAAWLAVGSTVVMGAIAFTPLAWVWYRDVSGLTAELTAFAILPTRILVLLPALSILLSMQRAVLVHGRTTTPITWSTVIEVGGILAALALLIGGLDLVGVTAAAIAIIAGRLGGNLYLVAPCARVLGRR